MAGFFAIQCISHVLRNAMARLAHKGRTPDAIPLSLPVNREPLYRTRNPKMKKKALTFGSTLIALTLASAAIMLSTLLSFVSLSLVLALFVG